MGQRRKRNRNESEETEEITRALVGQRSSPAGYILYCNIFIIKKFKMYNNNKTQTQKAKSLKHEI